MKIIKLIPVIIKNLFLIIIYELKKFWKRSGKNKLILSSIFILLVFGLGFYIRHNYFFDPNSENLTLAQAAKVGEMSTHKLMIELVGSTAPGQYERGDIIFIEPENYQFTEEQKAKFLIINVNLTGKQAELLTQPLSEMKKNTSGDMEKISLKRRKCAIKLWRAGKWFGDQKGEEKNGTYSWKIAYEK